MIEISVSNNASEDSYQAGATAAREAFQKLDTETGTGLTPITAFVFASSNFNYEQVLLGVRSVLGDTVSIIGASTAGEITTSGPTTRNSVALMLFRSDTVKCTTALAEGLIDDSFNAGVALAKDLQNSDPVKLLMMFADGLKGNGSAIIRGILSVLGENFPVVGGSAADNGKLIETHQFLDVNAYTDSVVGIGFSGDFKFSVGVNHGWNAVGAPQIVTKTSGATINEINNLPAISFYESYLGAEKVAQLKAEMLGEVALSYPLGIRDLDNEEFMLRAPFAVTEDGSIVCGGEVREGSEVQLMAGSKFEAIEAAKKAAETALRNLKTIPKVAFIFSCHVRNTLFANKETAHEEIKAIQSVIGSEVPIIGFYTYAEQAPFGDTSFNIRKCNTQLHNETVVITLIGE